MKEIMLTKGYVAIVDDKWFEMLSLVPWVAMVGKRGVYAVRRGCKSRKGKQEFMHLLVLDILPGEMGDHIDSNTLNNTEANLRAATAAENARNRKPRLGTSSPFKGVAWIKNYGKWRASIYVNGRSLLLGHFASELEAAQAYDKAALRYFGDFAKTNNMRSE